MAVWRNILQRYGWMYRHKNILTDISMYEHTNRHTDGHTNVLTDVYRTDILTLHIPAQKPKWDLCLYLNSQVVNVVLALDRCNYCSGKQETTAHHISKIILSALYY